MKWGDVNIYFLDVSCSSLIKSVVCDGGAAASSTPLRLINTNDTAPPSCFSSCRSSTRSRFNPSESSGGPFTAGRPHGLQNHQNHRHSPVWRGASGAGPGGRHDISHILNITLMPPNSINNVSVLPELVTNVCLLINSNTRRESEHDSCQKSKTGATNDNESRIFLKFWFFREASWTMKLNISTWVTSEEDQ